METTLAALPVLFVEAPNGPAGSGEAFNPLEGRLASLKGRKFYATFQYPAGPYRACVAWDSDDDPAARGLPTWTIPGGQYAKGKLANWTEHAGDIPAVFAQLSETYQGWIDSSRPSIEFYKSQAELLLFLPIV